MSDDLGILGQDEIEALLAEAGAPPKEIDVNAEPTEVLSEESLNMLTGYDPKSEAASAQEADPNADPTAVLSEDALNMLTGPPPAPEPSAAEAEDADPTAILSQDALNALVGEVAQELESAPAAAPVTADDELAGLIAETTAEAANTKEDDFAAAFIDAGELIDEDEPEPAETSETPPPTEETIPAEPDVAAETDVEPPPPEEVEPVDEKLADPRKAMAKWFLGIAARLLADAVAAVLIFLDRPFQKLSMKIKSPIGWTAIATCIVAAGTWIAGFFYTPT